MPLFIAISGYLFNVNKTSEFSFVKLFNKYQYRVILPWILAVFAYYSLPILQSNDDNIILGLTKAFVHPFYHLWFIPGFLSWVFMTWFLKKIGLSDGLFLSIALFLSVCSITLGKYPGIYQNWGALKELISIVTHTFRLYFFFFFALGVVYRKFELKRPKTIEYILPLLLLILVPYLYFYPNKILSIVQLFLLNIVLFNLIIKLCVNSLLIKSDIFEWMGQNSLAIYLWHVVPILMSIYFIGTENWVYFYSSTIALETILIFTYRALLRMDFFKKYIFGM